MSNLQAKIQRAIKLQGQGNLVQAQGLCREVLAKQPDHLQTLVLSGVLAGQSGDFARALRFFDKAIAVDPNNPATYCNRGLALQELARLDEALDSYDAAIKLKPDYAVAYFNRGLALKSHKQLEAALSSFERAIAINPAWVAAHYNCAVICQELERWKSALTSYDTAIALQPDHADAYNNRGIVQRELGQLAQALRSYERAIELQPANAQTYLNRGVTLQALGQNAAALDSYDRALALKPKYLEALFNRGLLLAKMQRWDDALASHDRAIEIDPNHAESYLGRGSVLEALARLDEAIAEYDHAIRAKPGFANAHFNRALALLARGELEAGWAGHEWRWTSESSSSRKERRHFAEPLWLGEGSLADKTIFVYSEQGLGDTLQFCRYLALLFDLGARVIFEVQKPLAGLLATLTGVARLTTRGEPPPQFDYQCPLMSLPLACKTNLENIPARIPYLHADTAKVARLRAELGEKLRPRIGLVWSGSATHGNDANRSISLRDVVRYLAAPFDYFCLQTEIRDSERELLAHSKIRSHGLEDFTDTAALCECMDLIISVDTSVAHLSGALGRKTWILLPFSADWRWLRHRDDSPWYPTARLFRQRSIGDWDGVLARVQSALLDEFRAGPLSS